MVSFAKIFQDELSNAVQNVLMEEVCLSVSLSLSFESWIIIIIDRFYIALFSAPEQTHCARMWFYMRE